MPARDETADPRPSVPLTHPLTRPPDDLTCRVLRTGDSELVLLSFTPTGASPLTEAERDVALAAARGASNADIARARGASPRTIANQLASVLRKLGVSSRVELASRFGPADFL